jgi:hypothetical protein
LNVDSTAHPTGHNLTEAKVFGKLGETVSQRLNEIVPAIYVPNSRSVTVAFVSGATLEGYEAPELSVAPFSGLDR